MPFPSRMIFHVLFLVCYLFLCNHSMADKIDDDANRPYEFSFNIVDFQHRYEKKDADGIVTGEYGFITADGVYHETGYATDKNGDFIITKMRNRKITSLKDAEEIFKDRPEAAKKLLEAVAKACGGCKIPLKETKDKDTTSVVTGVTESTLRKEVAPIIREMTKTLTEAMKNAVTTSQTKPQDEKNTIPQNQKDLSNQRMGKSLSEGVVRSMVDSAKKFIKNEELRNPSSGRSAIDDRVLEQMANDLYYRFNYTIISHGHQEDGYRSGRKDGSYRTQSENGVDARVKYVSNEFGHQPNISFVPRSNSTDEGQGLKGYSFLWYWQ